MGLLLQNSTLLAWRSVQETSWKAFLLPTRSKSSDKVKRANAVKTHNYETKALFGPIIKRPKGLKVVRLPTEKTTKKAKRAPQSLPQSLLALQQSLPPQPVTEDIPPKPSGSSGQISIPFDEETLKELVDFPLMFNKKHIVGNPGAELGQKMPSVGRILQATMPESARAALMRWKLLKIAELGEEGFRELNQRHLTEGARLHGWIEEFFRTRKAPEGATKEGGWTSVEKVLQTVEPKIVEARIAHPFLKYHGIVDCVSVINSELHVIEWKKSERVKPTLADTFDAPLQLAAYLGAVNTSLPAHGLSSPVLRGAVIVVYSDGTPAHVHSLDSGDVRAFWRSWLLRLQEYWIRARDGTLPEPI
ncbi:mitochondrial genome maintenance exonuclease 1-like [Phlebotomus argentipes]|uniref:mitochondrial genome maintenance exonuclease 1-like n=1 Tax=Phlebotomus argentipes TaxID=94469 RepID=UPI002892C45E|nr:mitochondrial genome maintenance exonuclease 1-like [Phlebotomus argentipes]